MKKIHPLYFIAVIPPSEQKEKIQELKESFANKYKCKAALKSPPHITLHMPFRFPEEKEKELIALLKEPYDSISSMISLNNFGCFPPRVIFIKVDEAGNLFSLYKEVSSRLRKVNVTNADYKNFGFNPHLTIAFRDLKKSVFNEAWPEYKQEFFTSQFLVDKLCLLKHNGKHWEEFRFFGLS